MAPRVPDSNMLFKCHIVAQLISIRCAPRDNSQPGLKMFDLSVDDCLLELSGRLDLDIIHCS